MALADFLGLAGGLGAPLTPDQVAALPPVQLPPAAYAMAGQPSPAPGTPAPAAVSAAGAQTGAPRLPKMTLQDFIGHLGDALYTSAGGKGPGMYEQLQEKSALQNYLGDPAGSMAKLMQVNPAMGVQMMAAQAQARMDYLKSLPDDVRIAMSKGDVPGTPEYNYDINNWKGKEPINVDGVLVDPVTHQPVYQSPYPKTYQGFQGGFSEQPRVPVQGVAPGQSAPGGATPFVNSPEEAAHYPPGTLVNTPYGPYHVPAQSGLSF